MFLFLNNIMPLFHFTSSLRIRCPHQPFACRVRYHHFTFSPNGILQCNFRRRFTKNANMNITCKYIFREPVYEMYHKALTLASIQFSFAILKMWWHVTGLGKQVYQEAKNVPYVCWIPDKIKSCVCQKIVLICPRVGKIWWMCWECVSSLVYTEHLLLRKRLLC